MSPTERQIAGTNRAFDFIDQSSLIHCLSCRFEFNGTVYTALFLAGSSRFFILYTILVLSRSSPTHLSSIIFVHLFVYWQPYTSFNCLRHLGLKQCKNTRKMQLTFHLIFALNFLLNPSHLIKYYWECLNWNVSKSHVFLNHWSSCWSISSGGDG